MLQTPRLHTRPRALDFGALCAAAMIAGNGCFVSSGELDGDDDGFPVGEDCNDSDASINPGVTEHCDGVDNDCNGDIDDNVPGVSLWFLDADGDGYGRVDEWVGVCSPGSGWVSLDKAGDCDDEDASTYPGAGFNEGCASVCMTDADGDGFGSDAVTGALSPGRQRACRFPRPGFRGTSGRVRGTQDWLRLQLRPGQAPHPMVVIALWGGPHSGWVRC